MDVDRKPPDGLIDKDQRQQDQQLHHSAPPPLLQAQVNGPRDDEEQTSREATPIPFNPEPSSFCFGSPQIPIFVNVKAFQFVVYKELLVQGSTYWQACLNGNFKESKGTVSFDKDVEPATFSFYVDLLHHGALYPDFKIATHYHSVSGNRKLLSICRLWRLANYFNHTKVELWAQDAFNNRMEKFSVAGWQKLVKDKPAQDVLVIGRSFIRCWVECAQFNPQLSGLIVTACANCNSDVFKLFKEHLDQKFMSKVTERIVERLDSRSKDKHGPVAAIVRKPEAEPSEQGAETASTRIA